MGHRLGLDLALLWLWHRPEATDPIRPLAWEPPCAVGAALKKDQKDQIKQTNKQKTKQNKNKKKITCVFIHLLHFVGRNAYSFSPPYPSVSVSFSKSKESDISIPVTTSLTLLSEHNLMSTWRQ